MARHSVAQVDGSAPLPPGDRPRPSAGADPRHELGRLGEQLACEHFERLGFRVLERNVRSRGGEIDLIAFDGTTLVFVEVKTRRARAAPAAGADRAGPRAAAGSDPGPLAGLRSRQRARVRRQAVAWLCDRRRQRPSARAIRLDAVGVTVDASGRLVRLEHLEAAW
jgi:putative endonuclease